MLRFPDSRCSLRERYVMLVLTLCCGPTAATAGDIFTNPSEGDLLALINCFEDPNVRLGASQAIETLGKRAVPRLVEALHSDSIDVQIWSVHTLGNIGCSASTAATALAEVLQSKDANLRAVAARSLGRIRASDGQSVALLGKATTDEQIRVRRWSVVSLGQIGPAAHAAVPQLIDALDDHPIRKEVIRSLIQIGMPAVPQLTAALARDVVRLEAAEALRQIDPAIARDLDIDRPTKADLNSLRLSLHNKEKDLDARIHAAESLGLLGLEAVPILIAAFVAEDDAVVRAATLAFRDIGAPAVPLLRETCKEESASLHAAAVQALAAIGLTACDAMPELIAALTDADRDVRHQAVRTLEAFGPAAQPAITALIAVMQNSRDLEATRQVALKTLARIATAKHEQILEALRESTKDSNYGISSLAKQMLKKLEVPKSP
jgi:HEAT repeat protein